MTIIGLDHIQLAMPPGEETAARYFYGELLGLTEIAKPEPLAARGGCWFEGRRIQLHLGVQTDFVPARKAHPAFLVNDLTALRAKLEAAHVPISVDEALPTVQRFHTSDPFGNRLEFFQDGHGFFKKDGNGC